MVVQKTRKQISMFAIAWFLGISTVCGYVTDNETASGTKRAFGDFNSWGAKSGELSSTQFYADGIYEVKGSKGESLFVDDKCSSMSFAGGTLKLGFSTQIGYVYLTRQMPEVLEVKNGEGLYLVNGGLVCRAKARNAKFALDGLLTVDPSSAGRVSLFLGDDNSTLRVNSKIKSAGGNNRPLYIGGTNLLITSWCTGNRVELAGDCSEFNSEIRFWTKGMESGELTASPELTLALGNIVLPCKVTVSMNGQLEPLEGKIAVVDTVHFNGNNWLNCTRGADKISLGKITVRNELAVSGGKVKVAVPRAPLYDGSYPVFEFPSSSAVSKDDFVLKEDHNTEFCTLDFSDDGEVKTLYLKYEGLPEPINYVYQTVTSAVLGGSESWSDGTTAAQSGKHYALSSEGLTDGTVSATLKMPADVYKYEFPGDSLMVDAGCSLKFEQQTSDPVVLSCKRLDLMDGSSVGGGNKIPIELSGGVINIKGTVKIGSASGRRISIKSNIAGLGCLRLCGHDNGTVPYSTYSLEGDNSSFLGSINMTMLKSSETTFAGNFSTLQVASANQLGGALPVLNRTALLLNNCAKLTVTKSLVLEKASNRGIQIQSGAQLLVDKNKNGSFSFTVETPLSLNGELHKLGVGELVLKGDAMGFGSDGLSENPTASKNIFSVRGGTLAVGSADAINGASVTFESGTKLELRPDFNDPDLMDYGIRNDKASIPFALGDGVSTLPFSIGTATGKPTSGVSFRLGLFTVKSDSDSVTLIRAAVKDIKYPVKGFKNKLVEAVDEEAETVTFAIDYSPVGFCLSIR